MSQSILSLLVLAGIAIFLILRLRNVLGTREGFEKPRAELGDVAPATRENQKFEVIEGGVDRDITDNVAEGSRAAHELAAMKRVEPSFNVTEFLSGAGGAYEMILMAFEHSDLNSVRDFLAGEVYDAFDSVVQSREEQGLQVKAQFVGLRELQLIDADFDKSSNEGEVKIRFVAELISSVHDASGNLIEGNPAEIKRQKDIWTFAREMGSNDPNWQLVATGA
ncbi:Tim44/TimA family putative adaptor protein [Celeribacter marinus]|uniref:Tim44/TimA family putative adaptor protein n=1 Tax=Celeribacter marinus TaxID=1397108 RepID=UPI003F6B064C